MPILVVTGYTLAGSPEPPESYVEHCLKAAVWSGARFDVLGPRQRREAVRHFIDAHPKLAGDAERLLRQAQ